MAYRAISVGVPGMLTSAIERSYRNRCHSDHRVIVAGSRSVDIRDEASGPDSVALTAYRFRLSPLIRYVDICDTAFVPDSVPQ